MNDKIRPAFHHFFTHRKQYKLRGSNVYMSEIQTLFIWIFYRNPLCISQIQSFCFDLSESYC
uniref:Uncharacterized protein n=1 Tax=Anguilla anguilla TaxID=7936 RepID=A0A0E9W5W5_ANGAN